MKKILVLGACGQIGTELTMALRAKYGKDKVIASDIKLSALVPDALHPYTRLDVLDKSALHACVISEKIGTIYHLAAVLSASGEAQPITTFDINVRSLLHVLDIAKINRMRVFWPSSIAVYGDHTIKAACSQYAVLEPKTMYGVSKVSGELLCKYYREQFEVDVRSLRFPGLISHSAPPGGGTTDYAVDIFHQALRSGNYISFLSAQTTLPMMYMPDAIRATLELMDADQDRLKVTTSYNLQAMSFNPAELAREIEKQIPGFRITYAPDKRQAIADTWPTSMDDRQARHDWFWEQQYNLPAMVADMLAHLQVNSKKLFS